MQAGSRLFPDGVNRERMRDRSREPIRDRGRSTEPGERERPSVGKNNRLLTIK
jgi:hypothetical protein